MPPAFVVKKPERKKSVDGATRRRRQIVVGTVLVLASLFGVMQMAGQHATPDFMILVGGMTVLCGLLLYDIAGRRAWEADAAKKIETVIRNHDRLVREVARSRNEVEIVKEGLADTAAAMAEQGKHQTSAQSVEAKMLQTIMQKLAKFGPAPRPAAAPTGTRQEVALINDNNIMELEIAPPPLRPPPASELDTAGQDPKSYTDAHVREYLWSAVRNSKVDVFIQPIVSLPQRKIRAYEVFARVQARSGSFINATRYMKVARQESLVPAIDNILLLRCLAMIQAKPRDAKAAPGTEPIYMMNISADTLQDSGFMGDLVTFLARNRPLAARLVFELTQAEMDAIDDRLVPVLDGLSKLGCRFSLDGVRKRVLDINRLKSRHVRFIKMDAAWLLGETKAKGGVTRVMRLKHRLDAAGIDLVVERIETEKALRELLDFNIDLGQGWLFGKPELMTAATRKAA